MQRILQRLLVQLGIPLAFSGFFLLVDFVIHRFGHEPWPDAPHLVTAAILLVASVGVLIVHRGTLDERAEARRVLTTREANYRGLFDAFPEPITIWSRTGLLLMQNIEAARRLGGTRDDFVGKTLFEIFGPECGQSYLERLLRVYDSGVAEEWEDVFDSPDGRTTYWTLVQRVKQPGGEDGIQVISYDITPRIKAEAALRAEHERAATYVKVAATIFVALDVRGKVTLINERGCEVLGYPEAEVVGRDWITDFIPKRLHERVRADYAAMIEGRSSFNGVYENPIVTRNGDERLISWHGVLLRDDQGEPVGVLSSGEDVTDRRRVEEALRESENLRIQERSALAERQRLARELHDSVSQALYGIALGVNTARTMLERDKPEGVRQALDYSISLARAGLSEMRALIFELRPESLESEGLAVALQKQAEAARARFEIPVDLEVCGEPPLPLFVKEALYRIAQEALHNAIKHSQAQQVTMRLECDDECWVLSIRDNGIGFDPLAPHPGHLGLKSMQERASSAGATLSITSAPGAGALVQVHLPIVAVRD